MILLLARLALAEDIQVTSNIKGATIYLNGADTGLKTPATIHGVQPGTVQVSVSSGCEVGEATVTVSAGATARASLMALPGSATVTVNPQPANATLFLDDSPYKHAGEPISMDCGAHTFRAQADGYVTTTVAVDLKADDLVTLPLELPKLGFGNLDLSVQPRNASMYLDGKPIGTDAVSLPSVSAGQHVISSKSETYKSAEVTLNVSDGDDQAWHFELVHDSSKKESTTTQLRGPKPGQVVEGKGSAVATATSKPASTSSSNAASSSTSTAAKTTASTTKAPAETGGDDYFSRLRAQQDSTETAAPTTTKAPPKEEEEDEKDLPPASSSSSKSTSSSSKSTSKSVEDIDDLDSAPPARGSSSSSSSSSSKTKSTSSAADDGKKKSNPVLDGLGIAGLVASTGAGAFTVYVYDRTAVAYDAYNAKLDAGRASQDPDLIQAAQDYYDNTLIPRRNLMYLSAGATVTGLVTSIVLIAVDEHGPYVAPMQGGAVVGWSTHW